MEVFTIISRIFWYTNGNQRIIVFYNYNENYGFVNMLCCPYCTILLAQLVLANDSGLARN